MTPWSYESLTLTWYLGGDDRNASGFVWSTDPIYFAATVMARNGHCFINTAGLHGLSPAAYEALREYLDSMLGAGTCICINRTEG